MAADAGPAAFWPSKQADEIGEAMFLVAVSRVWCAKLGHKFLMTIFWYQTLGRRTWVVCHPPNTDINHAEEEAQGLVESKHGGHSPGNVGEFMSGQGKCVLACMKFGQLVLRKVIEIGATRCQILRLKSCTKFAFGLGSAPGPTGGAYSAPQTP